MRKFFSVIISSVCGGIVFAFMIDSSYTSIKDFLTTLIIALCYVVPFVVFFGVPISFMIDSIVKDLKRLKSLIEISLYILFGILGAGIIILIFGLSDGTFVMEEFRFFIILALSCSIPFGISSVVLKNRLSEKNNQSVYR
ncbi:hypothetical protein PMEGAS67_55180 [Priestia megaterium]